jgi:hypothetical protein
LINNFKFNQYRWGSGSKELTLDQVMDVLINLRLTRSWTNAFKVGLPQRKIQKLSDSQFVQSYRKRNL